MPSWDQRARTLVGLAAGLALVGAVVLDLLGVAQLTSRHILILSGLISAGLGIDRVFVRQGGWLQILHEATAAWAPEDEGDKEGGDD